MRFFHFVEQHQAIRLTTYRLGQHAAFAIADIAGWGTFEARDRVGFLEFGHIHRDHMLLAAKEQISELARGFGFSHAAGADQQKYTTGLEGSSRPAR